jgi:hypothetical protein
MALRPMAALPATDALVAILRKVFNDELRVVAHLLLVKGRM